MELVILLQDLAPPSLSTKILNVFKSYLLFIARKDWLEEGQKVYELVLYLAQLNSFPPEGMADFFLNCVALENNTKSKEENVGKIMIFLVSLAEVVSQFW